MKTRDFMTYGNLNMHGLVRGAIQSINVDVPATLYVSTGRLNVRGIMTPQFKAAQVRVQVQADPHDALYHERGVEYTKGHITVYAYGNIADLNRPQGLGGDLFNLASGWWAVTQVKEWWPDWCCLKATQQVNATDLDALLAQISTGQIWGPKDR